MFNKNSGYGLLEAVRSHLNIPVLGKVFVVAVSTDANYDKLAQLYDTDPSGEVRLFSSLAGAYAATVTNRNDVLLLDAQSTHTVTAMLTVAKNRVHFIGMDGGGRLVQQGAKIQMGVTGVATDLAPIMVTGVRCSFRNLKVINASTTNESLYGFIENGEGTFIEHCSFIKTTGLDDSGHAHFWLAGDSATIKNCVFGQSNTPNTAAGYGILIDGKTGGATDGTVKENFLENIYINMSVGGAVQATSCFVKIADTAALNFGNVIKNLVGMNFMPSGGTVMTDAVLGVDATVAGDLYLVDPTFFGCTGVGAGATQGVQIASGGVAPVAAGGLSAALTD